MSISESQDTPSRCIVAIVKGEKPAIYTLYLVGGFNPPQKYARQIRSSSSGIGMKIKNILKAPPRYILSSH